MGPERHLIVLNFADTPSQALVHLPWDDLRGRAWRLSDSLAEEAFERSAD
jgi:hypothetical protein